MSNEFITKLTPSDIIQILGIIASFLTALVAIIISLVTMRQNSKMIEESSRAIISIYPQFINLIMILISPIVTSSVQNAII